jgi:hypothetical protein
MDTKRPVLLGAFCALLAGIANASAFDPNYETHFESGLEIDRWFVHSGSWSITSGRFVDGQIGAADIATVEHYEPDNIQWPTMHEDYTIDVHARVQNAGGSVGVVYAFQDLANYQEVSFSATGVATVRSIDNGVAQTVATGAFAAPGVGKWFHISVSHFGASTQVKVDGQLAINTNIQGGLPLGDVGLIAHNTRGQFDDFHARDFSLMVPFAEDFSDGTANRWQPLFGNWSLLFREDTDFFYQTQTLNETSISLSPVTQLWDSGMSPFTLPFTFKARMRNPYVGAGNLIGITWQDDFPQSFVEVVFSPRGLARINSVQNGRRMVLAEAPYAGGGPNKWFEVEVAGNGDISNPSGHVKVNGVTVFDQLPRADLRGANIGFVTHWVQGAMFDDVRASQLLFRPFSANMNDGRLPRVFNSPTSEWRVQDGTLNSFGVRANETAGLDVFHDIADTNFRARMVNHYANAGNLVGLTYAYRGPEDYFEVVFSPTGVARLNRVLKGQTTSVATASYSGGGQHQWFDVQLIQRVVQRQLRTTVKVNGVTVFNEVPQPDAGGAQFGLVAHWAIANFDDISVTEVPPVL